MFYMPYPFMMPPPVDQNNKTPRRASKRPGRKERNMQPKNFMQFLREHESKQKEYEEWLKAREKKDDKKKDEHKSNPMVTGMILFGLAQCMSLAWIYIFLHFGIMK